MRCKIGMIVRVRLRYYRKCLFSAACRKEIFIFRISFYGCCSQIKQASGMIFPGMLRLSIIEYFQFETRCLSKDTACRFAEKARLFQETTGRAALCRHLVFYLFQGENALVFQIAGYRSL